MSDQDINQFMAALCFVGLVARIVAMCQGGLTVNRIVGALVLALLIVYFVTRHDEQKTDQDEQETDQDDTEEE